MTTFFVGIGVGLAIFFLLIFGGRNEPTAHGQGVIATMGAVIGGIAMVVVWVIGFLVWLF